MAPELTNNAEFIDFEEAPRGEALGQSNFIKLAILISVLLHSLLLLFLIRSSSDTALVAKPKTVEIRLLPINPNKVPLPVPNDSSVTPASSELLLTETETETNEAQIQQSIEAELPSAPLRIEPDGLNDSDNKTLISESEPSELEATSSKTLGPTLESISQSVRDVSRANETQFYAYRCNPLEEEEGLKKCAPQPNEAYKALETSAVYQAFNPSRSFSRSERVSGVVSSQASGLSDRIRGSLPEGASGYLIEELEAGISLHANEGNRAVNLIIEMTDKSSAAAQARQVLGNPLLLDLKRAQENPSRGALLSTP